MSRTARLVFLALVAASFGAFFVAQRLKAEPAVLSSFKRVAFFSPNGDGRKDLERVVFRINEDDEITVDVVTPESTRVRRLATRLATPAGRPVRLAWDGRTDAGRRAPDGRYTIRVTLRRQGRSILAPLSFTVDTAAPRPAVRRTDPDPALVAPGQPVQLLVRGTGPRSRPRFRVLDTTVDPPRRVRQFTGERGDREAVWDGRTDTGGAAGPGTYLVAVGIRDRAGNFGWGPRLPPQPGTVEGRPGVTVRDLAVQPPTGPVRAGRFVTFRVDARGRPWRWAIRRVGESRPRKRARSPKTTTSLTVRAPRGVSGAYLFEVRSGRRTARVPFAVQAAGRSPLLVVLPVITWLGTDVNDDLGQPDGLPNNLRTGQPVSFPRLFVRGGGMPAGFASGVAPLLVTLDRARIRYDLTTDLELSGSPDELEDRPGVLLAGSHRWVTRGFARRLRRYVAGGGRVALFGTDQLRAGVQLAEQRLVRPTAAARADAFGQRVAGLRRLEQRPDGPERLQTLAERPELLNVFVGFDGRLDAPFAAVEELVAPPPSGEVVAALGDAVSEEEAAALESEQRAIPEQRPAFSVVRVGRGYVFRTGVAGWVGRLAAGDAEVAQITRNVVDLLRRVNPRPRSALR